MPEQYIVGVDLGSTTFTTTVAALDRTGAVGYLGHGGVPAQGMKLGEVSDQIAFQRAVAEAIEGARQISSQPVQDVVMSTSALVIEGQSRNVQVLVDSAYPIYQPDIDRALATATIQDAPGAQTIHRVVQGFAVNGEPIRNPVGRMGQTLEVWTRDFQAPSTLVSALQLAARGARTELHAIVPTVVAAGDAVLRPDERERGVVLIDIGGMTTEAALFVDGALFDFGAFKSGGLHMTRDLAMVLDVDQEIAEALKRRYGVGTLSRGRDLGIDWGPRGLAMIQNQARSGNLSRDVPRAIAGARFQQILHEVREWMESVAGGLHFYAGVVITGGASQMTGVTELAHDIFDMEARCGTVLEGGGFPSVSDPGAAASLGLVKYCALRASQTPATARSYVRTPAVAGAQPQATEAFMGYANPVASRAGRDWGRTARNWVLGFVPSRSDA